MLHRTVSAPSVRVTSTESPARANAAGAPSTASVFTAPVWRDGSARTLVPTRSDPPCARKCTEAWIRCSRSSSDRILSVGYKSCYCCDAPDIRHVRQDPAANAIAVRTVFSLDSLRIVARSCIGCVPLNLGK